MKENKSCIIWFVVLVVLVVGLILISIYWPPVLRWLWFGVFYRHLVAYLLGGAALGAFVWWIWRLNEGGYSGEGTNKYFFWSGVLLSLLTTFYIFWAVAQTNMRFIKDITVQATQLKDTTEIRYLPKEVAEKFGANKVQDSAFHLGDIDPIDRNGELDWVAPRIPTGFWNQITGYVDGITIVDTEGNLTTIRQPMKIGEGLGFGKGLNWQLWKQEYWSDLPEYYYTIVDGEILTIGSYISYKWEFPFTVPYWGGVFIIHPDGGIENLTPADAIADVRFEGLRLYPEALALKIGTAWAYKDGIRNAWFDHINQTEVPKLDGENQMPYLLPTADGPQWFIGMEPYGPAYSIFKMLYIDAHTGAVSIYELPQDKGIVGPNKIGGYIISAFPNIQWFQNGGESSSGSILAIEPRPIVKDQVLWWQVSVTNTEYSGVTKTVLVNGLNNTVIYFNTKDELKQFIAGTFKGYQPGAENCQETGTVSGVKDVTQLNLSELYQLIQKALNELERRNP